MAVGEGRRAGGVVVVGESSTKEGKAIPIQRIDESLN
jgi:hypothetical protein